MILTCKACSSGFETGSTANRKPTFCEPCRSTRLRAHNLRRKSRKPDCVAVPESKVCKSCGLGLPASAFRCDDGRSDGLRSSCLACERADRAARREAERNCPDAVLRERLRRRAYQSAKRRRIGDHIRRAIKRGGDSGVAAWFGYSIADLRGHLERQFLPGMSWEQFCAGEIHIDHIVPLARFDLSDEAELRAAWALTNLRPLWAADNIKKGARQETLL